MVDAKLLRSNRVIDDNAVSAAQSHERSMASRLAKFAIPGALALSFCAISATFADDAAAQGRADRNAPAKTDKKKTPKADTKKDAKADAKADAKTDTGAAKKDAKPADAKKGKINLEYTMDDRLTALNADMGILDDMFNGQGYKGVSSGNTSMQALLRDALKFNEIFPQTFDIAGNDWRAKYTSLNRQLNRQLATTIKNRSLDHVFDDKSLELFNSIAKKAVADNPVLTTPMTAAQPGRTVDESAKNSILDTESAKLAGAVNTEPKMPMSTVLHDVPVSLLSLLNNYNLYLGPGKAQNPFDMSQVTLKGVESSYGISMNDGVGYIHTPKIAINVDSDKWIKVLLMPMMQYEANSYAYPMDPTRIISSSGNATDSYTRPDVMRRMDPYNRATAWMHLETLLNIPLYHGESSIFSLDVGMFHERLTVKGQFYQLQPDSTGALVPNANAPTSIQSHTWEAFQSGLILGARYSAISVPMELSLHITPTSGAYNIASTILSSDGSQQSFDIQNSWASFPWIARASFPSITGRLSAKPKTDGNYDVESASWLGLEFGGGAHGTTSPFAYATATINYNQPTVARNMFTENPSGILRSRITPQVSFPFGETKVGGDVRVLEYESVPHKYFLGISGLAGYNTSSKVASGGAYGVASVRPSGTGITISVRAGYYGETGGDSTKQAPSSPFVATGIQGSF